jgi:RND family efflux transporter MFP subunit
VVLLVIGGIVVATGGTPEPEYLTRPVERRDLRQVVEAIGKVISERDLKLQFPMTGVVEAVRVQEGDRVNAGQELARLRGSGLGADISSANAEVQAALAELNRLQEGTRPEEIAVTEASVASKRAVLESARDDLVTAERNLTQAQGRLEALRHEAETSLQGYVLTARSDISQQLSVAESAVRVLEDIWGMSNVIDVLARHRQGQLEFHERHTRETVAAIVATRSQTAVLADYRAAQTALAAARESVALGAGVLDEVYVLIAGLPVTSMFTVADREAIKSDITTERSRVQTSLNALDSSLKSLRDASANFDTRIAQEEASASQSEGSRDAAQSAITTTEASLRIEEAQLRLQQAGSRPTEIAAAQARVNQARASLQRASERFRDTVIVAPIAGVITKIALKEGELLSTAFASDAAITMLGDEPFRVEMFAAEIDVPRVRIGQSGTILLDAFNDRPFALTVSELDPTDTEIDGVPKYRVKLDFAAADDGIKIGMTGDAEIFTDFRANALVVPGRAVIRNTEGREVVRVIDAEGMLEERLVTVGMEGEGGDLEILSGLEEGESVVELIRE